MYYVTRNIIFLYFWECEEHFGVDMNTETVLYIFRAKRYSATSEKRNHLVCREERRGFGIIWLDELWVGLAMVVVGGGGGGGGADVGGYCGGKQWSLKVVVAGGGEE